ncbi:ketose-bisphosphate aldolase [Erythrobacter arachoides]|uniref:Ketose-bisphosphate aldolase n=1 Tax=Aurantiacibacter arachoides TaxID=1850444 RepID=A0A845A258_9SPHN|nr:class II fructose-bisphosphate aldolase [Aurantiacibacter arachoides]MXO94018.1 ketose-bisphosphate aldolase [Aurantiacibacter arachoides]GGD44725.1 fructose-bisphosphate aldolase [Aurantiacibacter arachoides]
MPLVNMKPLLRHAMDNGYAVAAFNLVDYGTTKAMVKAAEELNAPVICQTSAKTIQYFSHREIVSWVRTVAEESPVPVVLHLDHCKDLAMIEECARSGWTSIMIDASEYPFEENLAMSLRVRDIADRYGVGMEAELGQIMGVEDDMVVDEADSVLTDPDDARRFCDALDLSAFACAVGTAHGFYKGEPVVDFDRIEAINRATGTPMALHGGTGLSDETFAKAIARGAAKVNISTNLKHVFVESVEDYRRKNPDDYEPLRVIDAQYQACKALFAGFIEKFGGRDTAPAFLASLRETA